MEIKVRFWDVRHQEMVYPPFFTSRDLVEEPTWKVMLWTGLKDKKGQLIYEGDIVKDCFGQINVITFGGGSFWFNWLEMPHYLDQVERGEVLGDIYRNANLLTQEGK